MNKKIFKILLLICFLYIKKSVYAADIKVEYQTHVQSYGWQELKENGKISGTTGESKRLEGIKINISGIEGDIEYQTHVQSHGWQEWKKNGELSGTTGESKRLEGIRIKLTGEAEKNYDVYYRTHVQSYGWQEWKKNGELSGTTGESKRLEAIEIKFVDKFDNISLVYKTYNSTDGWQSVVSSGELSGTTGESKALQKISIKLDNNSNFNGSIMYDTYSTLTGWTGYKNSGEDSGNDNNIEAIRIKLTDELNENYDVVYRVHVQSFGWLDWTKNDSITGTIGYFKRLEAIEIVIENKDKAKIQTIENAYKYSENTIEYQTHAQSYGWMNFVKNGELSGTTGESKRIEGFNINLKTELSNQIEYTSYVESVGWQSYVGNNMISGTVGEKKKIEAIQIKLNEPMSNYYDIYYRVHVSKIGWLGWAKNGQKSGSIGNDTQIEAIEISFVKKNNTNLYDSTNSYIIGEFKDNGYYDFFGNKATGFKFIDGTKYYFNEEGTLIGKNVKKVIDISSWQGDIDWDKVKNESDVDEVIIRVGWGMSYDDEAGIDSKFERNIKEVQRLKIPYSIYIFAYAKCDNAARKEAQFVIDMMNKYNIPKNTFVWYDAEISSIPRYTYESIIPIFVEQMNNNGYNNVGVYGSLSYFLGEGNLNSEVIKKYPLWIAQYYKYIQYNGSFKGWQFTSDGTIPGINGRVDVSMFY